MTDSHKVVSTVFEYFTAHGFCLKIGTPILPKDCYTFEGEIDEAKRIPKNPSMIFKKLDNKPKRVPVILQKEEPLPENYTIIGSCESAEDVIKEGKDFVNELMMFVADHINN